jgi:hypothetical protein
MDNLSPHVDLVRELFFTERKLESRGGGREGRKGREGREGKERRERREGREWREEREREPSITGKKKNILPQNICDHPDGGYVRQISFYSLFKRVERFLVFFSEKRQISRQKVSRVAAWIDVE